MGILLTESEAAAAGSGELRGACRGISPSQVPEVFQGNTL